MSKLKLYKYDYKPEFLDVINGECLGVEGEQVNQLKSDYGVLAQELKEIIPEAVFETGNIKLSDGSNIDNFLHVDKNRLQIECVGAVIALDDKTKTLDTKLNKLEQTLTPPLRISNKNR